MDLPVQKFTPPALHTLHCLLEHRWMCAAFVIIELLSPSVWKDGSEHHSHGCGVIIIHPSQSVLQFGFAGAGVVWHIVLYIQLLIKGFSIIRALQILNIFSRTHQRNEHSLISISWNLCAWFCSAWPTHSASRHLSAQAIRQNRVLIQVDIRIRATHGTETPGNTDQF